MCPHTWLFFELAPHMNMQNPSMVSANCVPAARGSSSLYKVMLSDAAEAYASQPIPDLPLISPRQFCSSASLSSLHSQILNATSMKTHMVPAGPALRRVGFKVQVMCSTEEGAKGQGGCWRLGAAHGHSNPCMLMLGPDHTVLHAPDWPLSLSYPV